jgi:hypothetical protein
MSPFEQILAELRAGTISKPTVRPRRWKLSGRRKKRVLKRFVWDSYDFPAPILRNNMEDNSIFVGASDFSDYVFSKMMKERYDSDLSTINEELKLHGNRKVWNEYMMQAYIDCKILQMNDTSGIILLDNLNFIRYDASSNSIEVKIYGDEKFVQEETDVLLNEFEEVTSYIEWIYSQNGDSVNVPLNTNLLPCDEMYPFLGTPLADYYDSFMKSNSNVLLLIGPPGTGKTTFIRGLLSHTGSSAMVTYDASILEKDFVFANFIEQNVNLLVLEDSDNFLKARSEGNTMMHRFLNVGDGLVTTKGKKLIFSTNLPSVRDVDEALIRPGRCFDILKFEKLDDNQAKALAEKQGFSLNEKKDSWTLAEIFGDKSKNELKTNHKVGGKIGFF